MDRRKQARRGALQHLEPGRLRYYIHDHVRIFRLQLLGSLTESEVGELDGCWTTAQSSIAGRRIQVDICQLLAADESGREWLAQISNTPNLDFLASPESAGFLPAGAALEIVANPVNGSTGNWLVRVIGTLSGRRRSPQSGQSATEGAHAIALGLSSSKTEISTS